MNYSDKICVIGHKGMLGHAICNDLSKRGFKNIIGCDLPELNLCEQKQTRVFFEKEKPEYIFSLAAVAAGINYKKSHPADMLLKNLQMITNVMESACKNGCMKMINVCSALIYPSESSIPLHEDDATYANLGEIDTPYALAKAAGMQLARYYNSQYGMNIITVVPCNFFGEYAPFEGDRAGVVPALIARIYAAKKKGLSEVIVWGTGNACRELLNSKDVASACVHLMASELKWDLINIGRGHEYSIRQVAEMVRDVVGYEGELVYDATKPEGRAHMQLDTSRLFSTGWKPQMNLEESIRDAYKWYENAKETNYEKSTLN